MIFNVVLRLFDSTRKVRLTWDLKPQPLDFLSDVLSTELVTLTQRRYIYLYIYIYIYIYIIYIYINNIHIFIQLSVSTLCPSCWIWNGAAFMRRKLTCIIVISVKPIATLKLLEQYGCPNTCARKNDFSQSSFS